MKKVLLFSLVLMFILFKTAACAVTLSPDVVASGTMGPLTWEITSDSIFTVSGKGAIPDDFYDDSHYYYDYRSENYFDFIRDSMPWLQYISKSKVLVIKEGVTSIGDRVFEDCANLRAITLPSSVTSIGGRGFGHCRSLTSITLPSGITSIGKATFYKCRSLTSIILPSSVTSIGYEAFYGCTNLASIILPSGLTAIRGWAFSNCRSLTSITIPNNVTSIGKGAFYGCAGLKSVTVMAAIPPVMEYGNFGEADDDTLYVPKGSLAAYKADTAWNAAFTTIKEQ